MLNYGNFIYLVQQVTMYEFLLISHLLYPYPYMHVV